MSIIDRVRSVAAGRVQSLIGSQIQGALPGLLGTTATGVLGAAIRGGPDAVRRLVPNLKAAPDLVLGEVQRRVEQVEQNARRQLEGLLRQSAGRLGVPNIAAATTGTPTAGPTGASPEPWSAAPLYGGLTLERYRQLFAESAMTTKAWKNLFFVSIEELRASRESPAGAGPINLLAVDVSFAPCTMPGEAVPIGGANMDKLDATDRVEVRMTTMDDARGTIKRWFIAKCDQVAHQDGTMGLPADYLVMVKIVHMDPLGEADPKDRMTHKFLMRPSNIELELGRGAPELELLPMSFVQFDTFMQAR